MIRISTHQMFITAVLSLVLSSCRKTEIKKEYVYVDTYEQLAQVKTLPLDSVLYSEAWGSCQVLSEGISPVTECGLCWDTDPEPIRMGNRVGTGYGKGTTKGKIEGLKPSTKYYLRAYAKNSEGISYGNQITFTTATGWARFAANPNTSSGSAIDELMYENGVLYASTFYNGVYISNDLGKTWASAGVSSSACFAVNGNSVYASSSYYLYVTTNKGVTWTNTYVGYDASDLLITNNVMYLTTGSGGVRRTTNNGVTWTPQNTGLSNLSANAITVKGTDLYLATNTGIYKSNNNASSWASVKNGIVVQSIEVCGANLIAGTTQGVYISKDDGATWTALTLFTGSSKIYTTGKKAVAWSTGNYLYISNDEGLTWKKMLFDITESPLSVTSDGSWYYGTSITGIYKLPVQP